MDVRKIAKYVKYFSISEHKLVKDVLFLKARKLNYFWIGNGTKYLLSSIGIGRLQKV